MENNIEKLLETIKTVFGAGVATTAKERWEQIYKHGFSLDKDAKYYKKGELAQAARYCLGGGDWPKNWGIGFRDNIGAKGVKERCKYACAFLCAEIDRLTLLNPL